MEAGVKLAWQFPDDFIAKGEDTMQCTSCQCSVSWLKKSHGKSHSGFASHMCAKLNVGKVIQVQRDLKDVLAGLNQKQHANACHDYSCGLFAFAVFRNNALV